MGWMVLVRFLSGIRFLSSLWHPEQLRGPPSFLCNGYKGEISPGLKHLDMELTTHLHLVQRSRMMELHLHSPIYLHSIVLSLLVITGRTSPFLSVAMLNFKALYQMAPMLLPPHRFMSCYDGITDCRKLKHMLV
jgi:hypothetical protein